MSTPTQQQPADRVERERLAAARRSTLLPAAFAAVLAASLGLSTAFQTWGWFGLSFVAVVTAFGLGWASRRLDVPGPLAPAVSIVGFVVVLGLVYYRDTTMFGIPSGLTIRTFGESLRAAFDDVRLLAAPVEATESLTILTACGVFLVALIVDALVFRVRRPVLAGLPLLALYVIPASLREDGVGALTFAIAAAGYVGLLISEGRERARGWGRRLAGRGVVEDLVDVSPVARVGRRLGAAAVSLALVVPVFVPDLGDGLMGGVGTGGTGLGDGPSSRRVINPIVQLKGRLTQQQPEDILFVRTNRPSYLRLTALDRFDAENDRWVQDTLQADSDNQVKKWKGGLPTPYGVGITDFDEIEAEIEVKDLDVSWLPVPYAPYTVDVDGDWRFDDNMGMTVFSSRMTTRRLDYKVRSRVITPLPEQLDGTVVVDPRLDRFKDLSGDIPPIAQETIDAVTDPSQSPYEKMVALQEFFRTNFRYDVNVDPGNGTEALTRFLSPRGPGNEDGRAGYCEQFAAAMAYLARVAGLPSRVAIGFTQGEDLGDGRYRVTNRDAHAWPEIYFVNAGWLRFEPTPPVAGVRTTDPAYTQVQESPGSTPAPTESAAPDPTDSAAPSASESNAPIREREDDDDPAATAADQDGSGGGIGWWMALWVATAGFVLSVPAQLRFAQRALRRRRAATAAGLANAAWCDLADDAEDFGYAMRDCDSPRAAAKRLAEAASLDGEPLAALTALGRAEERARYAPSPADAAGLAEQVREVRRALAATVSKRQRLRAYVLPTSTLRRVRRWAGRSRLRAEGTWSATSGRVGAALPLRRGRHAG